MFIIQFDSQFDREINLQLTRIRQGDGKPGRII